MDTVIGINPSEKVSAADLAVGKGFALGTVGRVTASDGKVYKFVKYNDGTANITDLAVGDVLGYFGADGYENNEVCADNSDQVGIGAGVNQHDATTVAVATGDGIWVQIRGLATVTAITAGADGNALTTVGAADRALDVNALVTSLTCAVDADHSDLTVVCLFPY